MQHKDPQMKKKSCLNHSSHLKSQFIILRTRLNFLYASSVRLFVFGIQRGFLGPAIICAQVIFTSQTGNSYGRVFLYSLKDKEPGVKYTFYNILTVCFFTVLLPAQLFFKLLSMLTFAKREYVSNTGPGLYFRGLLLFIGAQKMSGA